MHTKALILSWTLSALLALGGCGGGDNASPGGGQAGSGDGDAGDGDAGDGDAGDGDAGDGDAGDGDAGDGDAGDGDAGDGDAGDGDAGDGDAGDGDAGDGDAGDGDLGDGDAGDGDLGDGDGSALSHVFLPADGPANTRAPRVRIDAQGDLHAVYPAYAGGDAYYLFCPDNCDDPTAMRSALLPTEGTVNNVSLVVTRDGRPRVLLATALTLIWGECDDACTDESSWTLTTIDAHNGDRDVTGDALALDSQDRPRFIAHTYLALLGIGQKPPATWLAQCDGDCSDQGAWRFDAIQDEIWHSSQLRFDDQDRAHLATAVVSFDGGVPNGKLAAYVTCSGDCSSASGWEGIGLTAAFESRTQEIEPAISLALTRAGAPRVAMLGDDGAGGRGLLYWECDGQCQLDNWRGALISDRPQLGAGVELVMDGADHPRFVFTLGDNIGLYSCDAADCTSEQAPWELTKVEFATDLPQDTIILWPNCTIDGWALRNPSIALGRGGSVRVGYQALDLSGGARTTDPTKPACLAGTDMTLARMGLLPRYGE